MSVVKKPTSGRTDTAASTPDENLSKRGHVAVPVPDPIPDPVPLPDVCALRHGGALRLSAEDSADALR